MNAGMFDPRDVDSVALDSRTPNQMNKPSQRRLVCRWGHAEDGRLACTWRHDGPDDASEPWEDFRTSASPETKNAHEMRKPERRSEMTRLRAVEIEAYALSTMTGVSDGQPPALSSGRKLTPPQRASSRVQAVTQWVAIALGVALNVVLYFAFRSGGPL